jgi:hypothetical protein
MGVGIRGGVKDAERRGELIVHDGEGVETKF